MGPKPTQISIKNKKTESKAKDKYSIQVENVEDENDADVSQV